MSTTPIKTSIPPKLSEAFAIEKIRQDFPILQQSSHGKPLSFLDNGATAQKPLSVIESLDHYYRAQNANIHRGVYELSERATAAYEASRKKIKQWINANHEREIIFTRGTTEAINLVANGFASEILQAGDEVIISHMEHHSNIVPWQMACERSGATLKVIPIDDSGDLDLVAYEKLLNERTKLVSIVHLSNSLGTINPVKEIIAKAHAQDIPVLLDGAQALPHGNVDVQALGCEFYTFSGHKVFGPTGIGVLYGQEKWLEKLPPYQGGGDMILTVTFEKTTYNELPAKFEAGTPHIAGAIGLGTAIDYLNSIDFAGALKHEHQVFNYAEQKLAELPKLRRIGQAKERAAVLSFVIDGIHPHDLGTILDQEGIAIRTGHHCTMPVMLRYKVPATARASLAFYNSFEDIDRLVDGLKRVEEIFKV